MLVRVCENAAVLLGKRLQKASNCISTSTYGEGLSWPGDNPPTHTNKQGNEHQVVLESTRETYLKRVAKGLVLEQELGHVIDNRSTHHLEGS